MRLISSGCEGFVEENFFAFFFFPRLSAFQDAILVGGPNKCNLAAFREKFSVDVQTDFVTELGIGVGKEVFVGDIVDEGIVIENPTSVNFCKEF